MKPKKRPARKPQPKETSICYIVLRDGVTTRLVSSRVSRYGVLYPVVRGLGLPATGFGDRRSAKRAIDRSIEVIRDLYSSRHLPVFTIQRVVG